MERRTVPRAMSTDEPRVRRRNRLREKDSEALRSHVAATLGVAEPWSEKAAVETAEFLEWQVLLVDNKVWGLWPKGTTEGLANVSVRGAMAMKPTKRFVTVDMGAVKFVTNGADVMAPGIVEADPAIMPGDWVWIRDERNKTCLAVGHAIVAGTAMVRGKGKAVKALQHVGDKVWELQV
jgi:PUA domain protein